MLGFTLTPRIGIHVSALLAECNQARFKVVAVSVAAWDQRIRWGGGGVFRKAGCIADFVLYILCTLRATRR